MKNKSIKGLKTPEIHFSVSHPLFSESILRTNFYNELQKNGWCKVIEDKPEKLSDKISLSIKE